ncbi:hypothetical protein P0Y35_15810 [Kiritimatiellaeota bacterium B1221]|nr:hypothetical protein [Kiritimatiellaeota bacterium B1221]
MSDGPCRGGVATFGALLWPYRWADATSSGLAGGGAGCILKPSLLLHLRGDFWKFRFTDFSSMGIQNERSEFLVIHWWGFKSHSNRESLSLYWMECVQMSREYRGSQYYE